MKEGHSLQTTTFKPTPIGPKTSFSEETRTELSGSETFQECLRVYAKSPQGSSLEQQAIGQISKLARTFDDWLEVFDAVSPDSELGKRADERLRSTAGTIQQVEEMRRRNLFDSSSSDIVRKICASASSFDDWRAIYSLSSEYSFTEFKTLAESRLSVTAKTFDEWAEAARDADSGSRSSFSRRGKRSRWRRLRGEG